MVVVYSIKSMENQSKEWKWNFHPTAVRDFDSPQEAIRYLESMLSGAKTISQIFSGRFHDFSDTYIPLEGIPSSREYVRYPVLNWFDAPTNFKGALNYLEIACDGKPNAIELIRQMRENGSRIVSCLRDIDYPGTYANSWDSEETIEAKGVQIIKETGRPLYNQILTDLNKLKGQ